MTVTPNATAIAMNRRSQRGLDGAVSWTSDGLPSGLAVTGGTSAVSAATGSMAPNPYCGSRPVAPRSLAVLMTRLMTFGASRSGYFDRTSATSPEVMAAALLVPPSLRRPRCSLVLVAVRMSCSGAATTTCSPCREPFSKKFNDLSNPDTMIAPGIVASPWVAVPLPSTTLPALITTTTSCSRAYSTALLSEYPRPPLPPRDRLMTLAPWSTASRTAPKIVSELASTPPPRTAPDQISASGAIPR
ncbi:hypothetical protein JD76_05509 [Micromonospora endolithica]|nr:hypothetical protein JD76_05509 [Micromonospora endolithica]